YPYKTSPFWGELRIAGELGGYYNTYSGRARFYNLSLSSQIGTQIIKPCALLKIRVPIQGWYIINFETYHRGAKATLKHMELYGYRTVQTWDERYHPEGWVDHPALVNLSAGWHHFYWVVERLSSINACLYRVTVQKL
ncbi:MAG: hypothetical protein KJN62_08830, partial [Deltaproteobacteria bacterium]|nr:hypothetical protein [Deltaproteobacteria bacterium]